MGNIGIIGRARAGKDTAGKFFVDGHGYRRIGFADALKEAALRLDPVVGCFPDEDTRAAVYVHLSEVVGTHGWEVAKETPEVRRILQELGSAMRAVDEEVWLRAALAKVRNANDQGVPVVITDVRYRNEAASLVRAGFHLLHINRPGVPQLDHESERDLGPEDARYLVQNDGDLAHLGEQLELIWDEIFALESARHFARL
jgi:dephospho-CoA kinase